jgi:hypothetical protein
MRQRDNVANAEAPARRCRCTSAVTPRQHISRQQRADVEARSSRRRRFVATSALRLDVAGCSCLSRLFSARHVYTCRLARTQAPTEHYDQRRAADPYHAQDRATRREAWAMRSSGRAAWGLVGARLRLAASRHEQPRAP